MREQHDTLPMPWALPAGVAVLAVTIITVSVQAGRSVALLLSGAGTHWPTSDHLVSSTWGIITGDSTSGLPGPPPAAPGWLLTTTILLCLIPMTVGAVWAWRTMHGVLGKPGWAQRSDASHLLGYQRLVKNRTLIRPDQPKRSRFHPSDVGWRIGSGKIPTSGALWQPYDRTCGAIGPQGSGKTLDILTPALLQAPGGALVTLTKPADLLLTWTARSQKGPCVVLDPFGLAPGLTPLVWDPIDGCIDAAVAERRAKAFCAGTLKGHQRGSDSAAAFYAAEAAKVIQCYLHAAALTGSTLDDILTWTANPAAATLPITVLRTHPYAEPNWYGLLEGAIANTDPRTAGNTKTTVEQALALFQTAERRTRCIPAPGRPATNIRDILNQDGTIYLLGREDPYVSASPLMTAVAENVLDIALEIAHTNPYGRCTPPIMAVLDELPSTAALPTLLTRMANERALGICFIWASQTWRQLVEVYGEQAARAMLGLTNTLALFGGSKDAAFNKEISDLIGTRRIMRTNYQPTTRGWSTGRAYNSQDTPVIRPEELRELPDRTALILAENGKPILARLTRAITGKPGRQLLTDAATLRDTLIDHTPRTPMSTTEALAHTARLGLGTDQ